MFDVELFLEAVPTLATAAIVTVELTVCSAVLGLVAGTLSAMLQLSSSPAARGFSRTYVSVTRGTPLLVQLFVVFFALPLIGIKGQAFLAASIAIGLNSGGYVTEILRAAIQAVPRGQIEAARAMGLPEAQIWIRVILPQAAAASLPALTAELTLILKSTPLASLVAVTELTYAGVIIQARAFSAIEVFVPIAIGYIVMALALTRLSRRLEHRLRQGRGIA
jgi:polar amino acid transport system permease protein